MAEVAAILAQGDNEVLDAEIDARLRVRFDLLLDWGIAGQAVKINLNHIGLELVSALSYHNNIGQACGDARHKFIEYYLTGNNFMDPTIGLLLVIGFPMILCIAIWAFGRSSIEPE